MINQNSLWLIEYISYEQLQLCEKETWELNSTDRVLFLLESTVITLEKGFQSQPSNSKIWKTNFLKLDLTENGADKVKEKSSWRKSGKTNTYRSTSVLQSFITK